MEPGGSQKEGEELPAVVDCLVLFGPNAPRKGPRLSLYTNRSFHKARSGRRRMSGRDTELTRDIKKGWRRRNGGVFLCKRQISQ